MRNLRRGINRIFLFFSLTPGLYAAETTYLATVDGAYSITQKSLPASLSSVYSADAIDSQFTDYGGRFYRMQGDWAFGFSLQLYSAFNGRALLSSASAVSADATARKSAETGSAYSFAAGNYRLGLGWVPLQFRARKTLIREWLFIEAGTGPAYGFGALEYTLTMNAGTTSAGESRYHKYNEWGWLTSAMVGVDFHLHSGLSLQIFTEAAWLYAKIRNPSLLASESIAYSQYFIRPGVAVALRF